MSVSGAVSRHFTKGFSGSGARDGRPRSGERAKSAAQSPLTHNMSLIKRCLKLSDLLTSAADVSGRPALRTRVSNPVFTETEKPANPEFF